MKLRLTVNAHASIERCLVDGWWMGAREAGAHGVEKFVFV